MFSPSGSCFVVCYRCVALRCQHFRDVGAVLVARNTGLAIIRENTQAPRVFGEQNRERKTFLSLIFSFMCCVCQNQLRLNKTSNILGGK